MHHQQTTLFDTCFSRDLSENDIEAIKERLANKTISLWSRAAWFGHLVNENIQSEASRIESLWWIENYPGSRIVSFWAIPAHYLIYDNLSEKALHIWEQHLRTFHNDRNVIQNAIHAFKDYDSECSEYLSLSLVQRFPLKSEYLLELGEFYLTKAQENLDRARIEFGEKALGCFHKAIQIHPDKRTSTVILLQAAKAALFANNYAIARQHAQKSLEISVSNEKKSIERDVIAHLCIGFAAIAEQQQLEATKAFGSLKTALTKPQEDSYQIASPAQLAIDLLPHYKDAVLKFLQIAPQEIFSQEAKDTITQQIAKNIAPLFSTSGSMANHLAHKASGYLSRGLEDQARKLLDHAETIDYRTAVSNFSIGIIRAKLGEVERAIELVGAAIRELPDLKADLATCKGGTGSLHELYSHFESEL